MSLHRSLKTKPAGLNQHRNVLTRAERIEKLEGEDKFNLEDDSPIGLPKVASRKIKIARKKKDTEEGEGEFDGEVEGGSEQTEEVVSEE
jgi:small basic protein (TIGR04137 family)